MIEEDRKTLSPGSSLLHFFQTPLWDAVKDRKDMLSLAPYEVYYCMQEPGRTREKGAGGVAVGVGWGVSIA